MSYKAEYAEYKAQLESTLGISELDTYSARVINRTANGCWLEVDGVAKDIYLRANYPVSSELLISFNVRPKAQKYFPVVESVCIYGFDKVESRTSRTVA